jgi:hypothetical protein
VATFTHTQLMELWVLHGGLQQDADVAAAIAQAESGGCQYAKAGPTDDRPVKQCTYRQTNGENSYGLWQINRRAHPGYTAASLYTPGGNAAAAVQIAGLPASFTPWSTYTDGAYKQYLTVPVSPVPPGTTEPPTAVQQIEPNVFRGYRDLRNSLARHLPTQLERSRQTGQVTLRLLARHRKVRR